MPLSDEERAMIAKIPFSEEEYKKFLDIDDLFGEVGYHTLERNSCRPSFDVCGIWGGYQAKARRPSFPLRPMLRSLAAS